MTSTLSAQQAASLVVDNIGKEAAAAAAAALVAVIHVDISCSLLPLATAAARFPASFMHGFE